MTSSRWLFYLLLSAACLLLVACADSPPPAPVEVGESVYIQRCYACHGYQGSGTEEAGPPLAGVSSAEVRAAVTEGADSQPDFPPMAPVPIGAAQLDAVVTYLESLP